MKIQCEVCGKDPLNDRVILLRNNPPGEMPARWACPDHVDRGSWEQADREAEALARIIRNN